MALPDPKIDSKIDELAAEINSQLSSKFSVSDVSAIALRILAWIMLRPDCTYKEIIENDAYLRNREDYPEQRAKHEFERFKAKFMPALLGKAPNEKCTKREISRLFRKYLDLKDFPSGDNLKGLALTVPNSSHVDLGSRLMASSSAFFRDNLISKERKGIVYRHIYLEYESS
ncbi:MAG: hypothetical protein AAF703_14900 [Cyanobacteria bacterium P01_D01_bin.105]